MGINGVWDQPVHPGPYTAVMVPRGLELLKGTVRRGVRLFGG